MKINDDEALRWRSFDEIPLHDKLEIVNDSGIHECTYYPTHEGAHFITWINDWVYAFGISEMRKRYYGWRYSKSDASITPISESNSDSD